MLRTLEPARARAYRVPWRVDRTLGTHPLVTNDSDEPADFVRVFVSDGTTAHWGQVLPGETTELCLCEANPDTVVVTIAWFRPTVGIEYVWRFVL